MICPPATWEREWDCPEHYDLIGLKGHNVTKYSAPIGLNSILEYLKGFPLDYFYILYQRSSGKEEEDALT